MGIFSNKNKVVTKFKLVTDVGNGFYAYDGNVYKSDIVRACIRPKVKAIGKLIPKHIYSTVKEGKTDIQVNPDAYIRFLLEDPNPYMSGQKLQEKVATQLCLNSNAYILIIRDENGLPVQLYPLPAKYIEAVYDNFGELHLRFTFENGSTYQFYYSDIIHLREDYYENDIFGTSKIDSLVPLMEIVTTTDQGIVKAIKNSSVVRWLLKFHNSLRPEDKKNEADAFAKSFLSIEDGGGKGVAAIDSKADATQINPHDYVPNSTQMEKTTQRIYSFFNTNNDIVQSSWTEDKWNSYYEAEIEPVACDLSNEYTRKLFTRRERAFGNKIIFEASNLQFASVSTKLQFKPYIDIGAMLRNEWREIMNLAPLPDGDIPLLRKDTGTIEESGEEVSE